MVATREAKRRARRDADEHLQELEPEDLFDESIGYDEEPGVQYAPHLTPEEMEFARKIYNLFGGLWGLVAVRGDPGTGKDLFGNFLTYNIKRLFPWKRILRDEKPRKLFGTYAGVFNETSLDKDLEKMREVAHGVKSDKKLDEVLTKAADAWATKEGVVLLKNSALYLTELWRYCYKRDPHNMMNKTMGGVFRQYRHMDCLVVGTIQMPEDLDKFTCLPYVKWLVTCTKSRTRRTFYTYIVQRVRWDSRLETFQFLSRGFPISFDAGKPRSYMLDDPERYPDGGIVVKRHNYQPETDEERIILDVLNAGVTNYEQLVEVLETQGDMTEMEVADTLKDLSLTPPLVPRRKQVIDYPCYYRIYNSKSAPQMGAGGRVEVS